MYLASQACTRKGSQWRTGWWDTKLYTVFAVVSDAAPAKATPFAYYRRVSPLPPASETSVRSIAFS